MKKYCFGIDIGGTTVKCGLFNVDGEVLDKWEIKTRTENNGENIIADIAETINAKIAEKGLDKDEKEKETGHYIRKERYAGACSRSFYVGEDVEQADIKAEFKHGILTLFVPKKEAKPAVEQKKTIAIEG